MKDNLFFAFSTDSVNTPAHLARPNQRIRFDYLRDLITGAAITPPPEFNELPDLARRKYCDGDRTAGDLLADKKKALPYVLFSGFCAVHHNDTTLQYNGCLQIDLDFKTATGYLVALVILQKIKDLRPDGVLLATLSPSTFGVKILLRTNNLDKNRHGAASRAAIQYLAELLEIPVGSFDKLGASQACYLPFERTPGQAFFNPDAGALPINFSDPTGDQGERPATVYSDDQVSAAAQYLIEHQIDVASCYDEYLRITAACKNAFGDDGKQTAFDLLNNSAAFRSSNYSKNFYRKFDSLKRSNGKQATGATLVYLAQKSGYSVTTARPGRVLQANAGEYLTAVLDRHQIALDDVIGKYIVSPTGTGKTTLVAEYVRRYPDRRVVLVVPTKNLCDRIVERTHGAAVKFYGGRENRQITGDELFIVTTVHSFVPLSTRIDLQQYDVFFDEVHGLTADTSRNYKLDALRLFYAAKNGARSITYLTGTALYNFHPDFKQVERLVVTAPQRITKTAQYFDVKNILATVAEGVRRSVGKGRVPVVLVNDKSLKLAELKTALPDLRLAILNSDKKEDAIFKQITRTGEIPDDVQAIITTTVLKEGNDIYDDRAFDVFIVGAHHSSTIEQLTARFRTAQEVTAYIIKSSDRVRSDRTFNPYSFGKLVERRAQAFCDEHNNQNSSDDTTAIFYERELRLAIQERPVVIDQDGRASVCYFALNNDVFRQETGVEYANNEYQARNLRRYGFDVTTTSKTITGDQAPTHDDATVAAIKVARTECKEIKQKAHQTALDALQATVAPLAMVQRADLDNSAPKAFKWFKILVEKYNVSTQAAIDLLRDVDTGKKFALLQNRIRVYLLRSNKNYLDGGRILAIILQKIDKDLRPGRQYTADELREKLVDVLRLDKSIDLAFLQPDPADQDATRTATRRAVALLRMFFDVTKKGQKTSVDCTRNWFYSLNNLTQFRVQRFTTKRAETTTYTNTANFDQVEREIVAALVECPF
jgi:hypothetical protein